MKCYITEEEWLKLEKALMENEISYSVSFDSHIDATASFVVYDKQIIINPVIIQTKVKYRE